MTQPRILIVDDERNFREFLGEALGVHGYEIDHAATARVGLALARQRHPHVVLLDQNLPDCSGLDIISELRALPNKPVVVVITAYAEYSRAVDAVKSGAFHYIAKPFEFSDLLDTISHACTGLREGSSDDEAPALASLVGDSTEIAEVKRNVARIAQSPVNSVLVQGESGTGKELVARAIHELSDRSKGRLVSVNCAALTETLLMSELFGHERGAFTDAREQRKGVFEAAHQGTLFLDEISEIGPRAQAALLRVLEERIVTRVGGTEEIPVDVRVVAASNRPLNRQVEIGAFRADLYYRLNVVQIALPPLRERISDLVGLAQHLSDDIAARYRVPARQLTPEAMALLAGYPWPGNVRELRNAIEHAYIIGTGPSISQTDLPHEILLRSSVEMDIPTNVDQADVGERGFHGAKRAVVNRFERTYLETLLTRTEGNITRAAEEAGVVRQAFQKLLSRHGLSGESFRR
ncbi:MAG TPA: sigma-54 dependent transcriptional regulator [Gemmatimonadaceae bacterium]